ncbi:MAG: hypothetical protein IJS26_06150 [Alphaproteobacteria bacterium]|nr:hypothetical protein [Alphaproteobacteria bacterium]
MKKFFFKVACLLLFCFCAKAEVSFEAGVNVQKQAEDSSAAREEAMKEAYRTAFIKVAERLTTKENVDKLGMLTDAQLVHFIKETDIVSEKTTSNEYMADLNIKINGPLLKQYMFENNMRQIVAPNVEVLILPSYADTQYSGRVLFEDGNVWRQILLEKGALKIGNLSLKVIEDTPQNREILTPKKAVYIDEQTYAALKANGSFDDVFTVHAVRAGRNNVVLLMRPYNGFQERIVVSDEEGEPFEKAVDEMVEYIARYEQNKNIEQSAYQSKISGIFYQTSLREWLMLEKKLNTIEQIQTVERGAMDSGKISFSISFSGTLDALVSTLKQQGIDLSFSNGQYVIK